MLNKDLLPDFVIIGAGKSGTTSLDNYLSQHPDIFMSPIKEPDFFAYETVDPSTLSGRDVNHYNRAIKTIGEYQALFRDAKPGQKKGETSNTCLSSRAAAERMKYYIPDAKLVAIFRQPTQRLFSRFMHLERVNRLPSSSFEDVLDRNSIWWKRKDLIPEGYYATNLRPFYELFPAENIRIYLSEDLRESPKKVIDDICMFIGVKPYDQIDYSTEHNRSGIIKNKFYDRTIGSNSVIKKTLRKLLPDRIYFSLTRSPGLKKITQNINNANLAPAKLDPELYRQITKEIYADEIKELESLIRRDLTHWLD